MFMVSWSIQQHKWLPILSKSVVIDYGARTMLGRTR